MRDTGCFDDVGLVERVEATDVQVAGSGDAVDPAHCCSVLMLSLDGCRRGMIRSDLGWQDALYGVVAFCG